MSAHHSYEDVAIWEKISSSVEWDLDKLVERIKSKSLSDTFLLRYSGRRQILEQRANCWAQEAYDICCTAWGRPASQEFNRAAWEYAIGPFIMQHVLEVLELVLAARPGTQGLTQTQKTSCYVVRNTVLQQWQDRLLPTLGTTRPDDKVSEAASIMAHIQEEEAQAMRIASGLPPTPPPPTLSARVEDIVKVEDIAEEGPALDPPPSAVVAEEDRAQPAGSLPNTEPVDLSAGLMPKESTDRGGNGKPHLQADSSKLRASEVQRVLRELTLIRPHMTPQAAYKSIRAQFHDSVTFTVCDTHKDLKLKLENIQEHQQFVRFAKEIVAAKYGRKYDTVDKDWKTHKPRKEPSPQARRTTR